MATDDLEHEEINSFQRPVTRDDLGRLGGNARFQPPESDRSQQIAQGQRVTARHTWLYPWSYWI